jgi:hypothetical protein
MPRKPALPSRRIPLDIAKRFAGLPSYDRPKEIRVIGEPEPGYFKLRLVRKGPPVPAIIWRPCPLILPDLIEETAPGPEDWLWATERARPLRARIGNDEACPFEVWERGQIIGAREYAVLLARGKWAMRFAPAQPEANPRAAVVLDRLPSLF